MSNDSIEQTLSQLATTRQRLRKASNSPRYPQEIRNEISGLIARGVSSRQIVESTGFSTSFVFKCSKHENSGQSCENVRILPIVNDSDEQMNQETKVLVLKTSEVEVTVFSREA